MNFKMDLLRTQEKKRKKKDSGLDGVQVTTENKNVEAKESEEAVLSCMYTVEKNHSPRVEWKKIKNGDVSFVYFGGTLVGSFKNRAEMMGASIRVKKVMREDAGEYRCEVSAEGDKKPLGETSINLRVLVPPASPVCGIPSSVMTGTVVELTCRENDGIPSSLYYWYKNGVLLPENPVADPRFSNASFTVNRKSGTLQFNTVSNGDSGEYYCTAENGIGKSQKCSAKRMQVDDLNVSGIIIAAVVVALVMALCGLGVYYAQKKGCLSKGGTAQKPATECRTASSEEHDFKHTQSFVI
ncbi:junctional adhesion molecule B isoform X1 [Latimeria chalumnae]|uniref:junctional adhesion molecule B isoform X1 n=1 Tax=Latimeria chalumnae TaxID=7897 RepID=UPI00313C6C51